MTCSDRRHIIKIQSNTKSLKTFQIINWIIFQKFLKNPVFILHFFILIMQVHHCNPNFSFSVSHFNISILIMGALKRIQLVNMGLAEIVIQTAYYGGIWGRLETAVWLACYMLSGVADKGCLGRLKILR